MAPYRISVIIPVLNEAANISRLGPSLPPVVEKIVVDGGSIDDTVAQARAARFAVIESAPGRAVQMNAGATAASGEVLLFLHADTTLPDTFPNCMDEFMLQDRAWGRFDVRLSGGHPIFRVVEFMMNWRSRLTGICTGDMAMFVRRDAFEAIGGFATIPLMEDIEISERLSTMSRPRCINDKVISSSRRWEENGILPTILLMWRLRLAYWLGASPDQLVRRYYPERARW